LLGHPEIPRGFATTGKERRSPNKVLVAINAERPTLYEIVFWGPVM
jgi:hypothetical protein